MTAATSAREILTGLHDVMAARGNAQAKLDRVVDLIAEAMASEVCSIYLLRDNKLELFATHGLRKEAVHVTRLAMGEGLVGTIAEEGRILNLAEAASHPEFVYRPETGEESFHSFAGVPIVRLESPIGVLRRPACRAAPLRRGRDRGAADGGDGAVGDDRRRAAGRRRPPRPDAQRRPAAPLRASSWSPAWPRAKPSSTSRG